MRIKLEFYRSPQFAGFTDSINAAIVAGLVAAGVRSEDVVGQGAKPWTFGAEGKLTKNLKSKITSLTISTPDQALGEALAAINPDEMRCTSTNGDILYFGGARKKIIDTSPAHIDEMMVHFASPFAIATQKAVSCGKKFVDQIANTDIDVALRTGLERRAGRSLDVSFHIDPLSLTADTTKRVVPLRKSGKRTIYVPAFKAPMTFRGNPKDVEFAFLAGLGAKTHAGFGCPIFMN